MTGDEFIFSHIPLPATSLPDALEQASDAADGDRPRIADSETVPALADIGLPISPLFEAAVTGVQLRFKHLSKDDIIAPPHQWFDAALARQIALHLLHREFDVPKRALAGEIVRSREAVNRALRTVDERLQDEAFASSYSAIKRHAIKSTRRKTRLMR
ncbi:MAG: hypothetical protein NXH91_11935 [Phyllobacteriaceae bacterium]|nr:hypothetical protein [Phyllobacteriaceae bacterium]